MLDAYYTQGYDSHSLFDHLNIAKTEGYETHLNKHHVIYINFSRMPDECHNYDDYIRDIRSNLKEDIYEQYPGLKEKKYSSLDILLRATKDSFIFILDEWDSIFYKNFMKNKEEDKMAYLEFLNGLLKDQPYVELAYMTGVLPIAKYSSGSALNVFKEYSFLDDHTYDAFFGFSEHEVRKLCEEKKTIPYDQLHSCAQSEVLV